ncbi:MAG: Flp family type IVb pilin [Acidimicrobiales bacterium]
MTGLTMMLTYCRAVVRTRVNSERGASVIEYAFLASLIAVFCIGAVTMIGNSTAASLSETNDKLPFGPQP